MVIIMGSSYEKIKEIEQEINDLLDPKKNGNEVLKTVFQAFHKTIFEEHTILKTYKNFLSLLVTYRASLEAKVSEHGENDIYLQYRNMLDSMINIVAQIIKREKKHLEIMVPALNKFYKELGIEADIGIIRED